MDQAEPKPLPGQPERPAPGAAQPGGAQPDGPRPYRPVGVPSPGTPAGEGHGGRGGGAAGADPRTESRADSGPATDLAHPVVVGYDGSGSSRHALAYAAGMARRLGRPLLLAYITSPSIFCEPLSGQVIAPIRDTGETHRWLLAE